MISLFIPLCDILAATDKAGSTCEDDIDVDAEAADGGAPSAAPGKKTETDSNGSLNQNGQG